MTPEEVVAHLKEKPAHDVFHARTVEEQYHPIFECLSCLGEKSKMCGSEETSLGREEQEAGGEEPRRVEINVEGEREEGKEQVVRLYPTERFE